VNGVHHVPFYPCVLYALCHSDPSLYAPSYHIYPRGDPTYDERPFYACPPCSRVSCGARRVSCDAHPCGSRRRTCVPCGTRLCGTCCGTLSSCDPSCGPSFRRTWRPCDPSRPYGDDRTFRLRRVSFFCDHLPFYSDLRAPPCRACPCHLCRSGVWSYSPCRPCDPFSNGVRTFSSTHRPWTTWTFFSFSCGTRLPLDPVPPAPKRTTAEVVPPRMSGVGKRPPPSDRHFPPPTWQQCQRRR